MFGMTQSSNRRFVALVALIALSTLGLAACGSSEKGEPAAVAIEFGADQWIANGGDFKEAANWDVAEKPTLTLGAGAINPASLDLVAGMPYEIMVINNDKVALGFEARDLFRASAVRKTESGAEIKIILFKEIFVNPGKSIRLFIIPVVPGTYALNGVDAAGAQVSGMTGTVNVTGAMPTEPAPAIENVSTTGELSDAAGLISSAIPTWDTKAVKATIVMGDTGASHFFKPKSTVLKIGVPTILTFENQGNTMHVNEMMDFYKTVAFWKVVASDGWATGALPKPADVDVPVSVSIYFIPTVAGTYQITDSAPEMSSISATIVVK